MKREIEVVPTVEELASAFAELGSREQAHFLALADAIFRTWGPYERDSQIIHIGEALAEAGEVSPIEFVRGLAQAVERRGGGERGP